MTHCSSEVGLQTYFGWDFRPTNAAGSNYTGVFSLRSNPALCVAAVAGGTAVALAACNPSDANQVFAWSFEGIAPDTERKSQIASVGAGGKCLDITGQVRTGQTARAPEPAAEVPNGLPLAHPIPPRFCQPPLTRLPPITCSWATSACPSACSPATAAATRRSSTPLTRARSPTRRTPCAWVCAKREPSHALG